VIEWQWEVADTNGPKRVPIDEVMPMTTGKKAQARVSMLSPPERPDRLSSLKIKN